MNKQLFIKVVLNHMFSKQLIFKQIYSLHQTLQVYHYSWAEIQNKGYLLASYGYLELFKKHCANNNIGYYLRDYAINAARHNRLDVLKYILENYQNEGNNNPNLTHIWMAALARGNIEIMEYLYTIKDLRDWDVVRAFSSAALSGKLSICQWFAERFPHCHGRDLKDGNNEHSKFYNNVVQSCSLDILEWGLNFYQKDYEFGNGIYYDIWNLAMSEKHITINLLNGLFENKAIQKRFYETKERIAFLSVQYASSETIDWLASKNVPFSINNIFRSLCKRDIDFIKYIYSKFNFQTSDQSSNLNDIQQHQQQKQSDLEFIEWFCKMCIDLNINAIDSAMNHYNLPLIKWIHENTRIIGSENALDIIIENGNLDILKWFTESKRVETISEKALKNIKSKIFEMTEYILRNRTESFPFNVISQNLSANRVEFVKWIVESNLLHRCGDQSEVNNIKGYFHHLQPNTQEYIIYHYKHAIPDNFFESITKNYQYIKHLIESDHPINYDTFQQFAYGHLELIQLVKEKSSSWNHILKESSYPLDVFEIDVIKYLVEHGFKCSIDSIAGECDLETIKYLIASNCYYTIESINNAIEYNSDNKDTITWMLNNLNLNPDEITKESEDKELNQIIQDYKLKYKLQK